MPPPEPPAPSNTVPQTDRANDLAWTIVKVIFNLARFALGAIFTVGFFMALVYWGDDFSLDYAPAFWSGLWHVLLCGVLAFFIWPQRYGPPTKLIELYQRCRTNKLS